MKNLSILALAVLLAGCALGPLGPYKAKIISLPNGEKGKAVDCRNITTCYTRATEACAGEYEILDKSTQQKTELDGRFDWRSGRLVSYPSSYTQLTLLIKCKENEGG